MHRKTKTKEEREERLTREKVKRDELAAEEAAVDRMIRLNIAQFGP